MREVWGREIREEEDMRGVGEREKKIKEDVWGGGEQGRWKRKKNNLF
jgi:hypothetical protein